MKFSLLERLQGNGNNTSNIHTPDVLSCLANLSNDEVFTPPEIVNQMLDMLPQDIFKDPNTKFLDPACKTGVFLREIAKKLLVGLEPIYPDLQERIDHIFHNQLYGIAITELTSLLSRRSLYCSKYPNGQYSITKFDDAEGNIRFKRIEHTWVSGKCLYCGASQITLDRGLDKETYAYEFIHKTEMEELKNMNFDVIISNPPYQLNVAKLEEQQNAVAIYNDFVESAIKLNPRYICMITPSRWMTGGRGLDEYRKKMINNNHISVLHDFENASECFPGVEIKGGVSYFLMDRFYNGQCDYYLHKANNIYHTKRYLNDLGIGLVIRDNRSLGIINKVVKSPDFVSFKTIAGSQTPFGIVSSFRDYVKTKSNKNSIKIYGNKFEGYTSVKYVKKNFEIVDTWKVFAPKAVGSGIIESDRINPFVPERMSICTQTYIVYGSFDTKAEAENLCEYMKTKFFHFLLGQLKNTQQMSPELFSLVPLVDFKTTWDDSKLYKKYNLTKEEIDLIESSVWPETEK